MSEMKTILALFDEIEPAADGIEKIRDMGITNDQMDVVSGVPVTEPMMGRPHAKSNVPRFALLGALGGIGFGLFLAIVTPLTYPLSVGGMNVVSVPPSIIIVFEMMMLGMLIATFLGVFLDSNYPSYAPKIYVPELSDGKIAVIIECPDDKQSSIMDTLEQCGACEVREAEAQQL